jgi:uncharacterized membrane protein
MKTQLRYDSIDILRGLAIIGMVLCHAVIYTSRPGEGEFPWVNFFADQIIGDWPAALFLFLSGLSFIISSQKATSEIALFLKTIKRFVVLFITGLLFLVVVWGHADVFDWDILTTIATSLLILYFLRNLPLPFLIALVIIPALFSPWLFHIVDGASLWPQEDEFDPGWDVQAIVHGFLVAGYFPILPWFSYALAGLIVGKTLFLNDKSDESSRSNLVIFGFVLLLIGISLSFMGANAEQTGIPELVNNYFFNFHFYPLSLSLFLVNLGAILLIVWYSYLHFEVLKKSLLFFDFFRIFSKYSLSIYILHHILFVIPQRILGAILHDDEYAFVLNQEILSPPFGLLLGFGLLIIFYGVFKHWDKSGGKYSFEWLFAKITGK